MAYLVVEVVDRPDQRLVPHGLGVGPHEVGHHGPAAVGLAAARPGPAHLAPQLGARSCARQPRHLDQETAGQQLPRLLLLLLLLVVLAGGHGVQVEAGLGLGPGRDAQTTHGHDGTAWLLLGLIWNNNYNKYK